MAFPRTFGFSGKHHTEEAKLKMREAHLRRCADPVLKAEWRETPAARRHWLDNAPHRPVPSKRIQGE
jgi:hypothetical protein